MFNGVLSFGVDAVLEVNRMEYIVKGYVAGVCVFFCAVFTDDSWEVD